MVVQWFPGHMARARRVLAENLKLVDVVVELADARLPFSSRNPEFDRLLGNKPRVLVMNKADLADPAISSFWTNYYREKGIHVLFTDCRSGDGVKKVINEINEVMAEKTQRCLDKGRRAPVIHAMVVGIPNVGKSSFINRVAGRAAAVTGDKPGVTRNKQWLKMNEDIFLLDMPGLLWPKFENQIAAVKLACSGAIKDDILDVGELAAFLLVYLEKHYPDAIKARYKIELPEETEPGHAAYAEEDTDDFSGAYRETEDLGGFEPEYAEEAENAENTEYLSKSAIGKEVLDRGVILLEACGKKRGCLLKGGEVDYNRIANIVLDDFRAGKIGRLSLDFPEAIKEDEEIRERLAAEAAAAPAKKKKKRKR